MATAMEAEEEINWQDYLDPTDADVPLHALGYSCVQQISYYLNKEVLPTPGMINIPNFGGLGELIGLDPLAISEMSRRENPGLAILDLWKSRKDVSPPTVGNLVKFLAQLGREDILTDSAQWIKKEIKSHKDRLNNIELQSNKVTDSAVEATNAILTIDDVVEGTAIYDAFICYDTADVDFVKAMIARLEDPRNFGFRFFVPGRNNLVGSNSHALTTRIISERCRHVIVVLSKSFLQSQACEFQTAYTFSLSPDSNGDQDRGLGDGSPGRQTRRATVMQADTYRKGMWSEALASHTQKLIGARDKKIVPLKIEECRIPDILQILACCDFTNPHLLDWCWRRLAMSIMCSMPNPDFLGPQQFIPPSSSAIAQWARFGMPETGGAATAGRTRLASGPFDSGCISDTTITHSPVTAPVSPFQSQAPTSSGGQCRRAPVASSSTSTSQNNSPSPVSQVFKRFTQTFTSSASKTQKKKSKSNHPSPAPAL